MSSAPIRWTWTGEAMVPRPAFMDECQKRFKLGGTYLLKDKEERSEKSERHFFAQIREAWVNLPEDMAEKIPSADHLRKWALILSGYRDERTIVAATPKDAMHLSAFAKSYDEYAVVTVDECVVTIYTAKSQDRWNMSKAEFQQSKDDVLRVLAERLGTTREMLAAEAAYNRYEGRSYR